MSWAQIAVVGGVNLDILGQPSGAFHEKDSLIGSVRFSCGGVGKNIAAQAVRLGADAALYTVFGSDRHSEWLRQACLEDGIRIDRAMTLDGPSPVYMAIHGSDGDMLAAVNDMFLLARLTPEIIDGMAEDICRSDVCVADANLSHEALLRLAERISIPLVCDPVSNEKAQRVLPLLPRLTAIKPNLYEARAMSGLETPEDCAAWMIRQGVRNVFISLGREGLYYRDANTGGYMKPTAIAHTQQTGAGDALTAGITIGIANGRDAAECARLGMAAAARFLKLD